MSISACAWTYLMLAHGRFFTSRPQLEPRQPQFAPDVDIVIPARDEAATIDRAIGSLLEQEYAGAFRIILVDDESTDGTAQAAGRSPKLDIVTSRSKPPGWSGKLWALQQGLERGKATLVFFSDADIVHDPRHLASLVAQLVEARLDMVSEMVRLNCESRAERLLVPAFVYFFQMLYPFAKVNHVGSSVSAAAGGTVLIRRGALERIGGLESMRGALIDDVALATKVKESGGSLYLGHSGLAASIRPYPRFSDIWDMISRTAFTQLRYSGALLIATLGGLALLWWVPLGIALWAGGPLAGAGAAVYAVSAASYWPTLERYGRPRAWSLLLPLIASFYMGATFASAWRHWSGRGARWKMRDYPRPEALRRARRRC